MKSFGSPIASVLAGILFAGTGAAFAAAAAAARSRKGSGVGNLARGLVRVLVRRPDR